MSVTAGGVTLKGNIYIGTDGGITVTQTEGSGEPQVSIKNCIIGLPEAD